MPVAGKRNSIKNKIVHCSEQNCSNCLVCNEFNDEEPEQYADNEIFVQDWEDNSKLNETFDNSK